MVQTVKHLPAGQGPEFDPRIGNILWRRKWQTPQSMSHQLTGPGMMAEKVKSLPSVQETRIQSLSQEDHLEKEMATQSSIFA